MSNVGASDFRNPPMRRVTHPLPGDTRFLYNANFRPNSPLCYEALNLTSNPFYEQQRMHDSSCQGR